LENSSQHSAISVRSRRVRHPPPSRRMTHPAGAGILIGNGGDPPQWATFQKLHRVQDEAHSSPPNELSTDYGSRLSGLRLPPLLKHHPLMAATSNPFNLFS